MMRVNLNQLLCILLLIPYSGFISAYEIETHKRLSEEAYTSSNLNNDPNMLANLGLFTSKTFPNSRGGGGRSIIQLIGDGAQFEDNTNGLKRPLNHFYDPVHNAPLNIGGVKVGDLLCFVPSVGCQPTEISPDWALEDSKDISQQNFSFKDARQYFYNALTLPVDTSIRDKFWGLTFQSLGQVIHHIQDMAQPQHVRNDMHLDENEFFGLNPLYNPSLYEKYTRSLSTLPFSGYTPVYSSTDTATFSSARKFWHTDDGKGLADYTNRGFVSAGTIFSSSFPAPVLDTSSKQDFDIQTLLPGTSLKGLMTFYSSTVTDNYKGTSVINPWAVTSSIFDADLKKYATIGKKEVFTLNRFNFGVAHTLLIPRAVGYSAGLINYFFRGKMAISLPPDGAYSLIDPSTSPNGFSKVKLTLANTSPAGENMIGGTVVAVAKFHNNNCYQPDLSGEYGLPGKDYATCRSSEERIVVSAPQSLSLAAGATTTAPLVFDFSSNPIPLSATDLYLQVVYRGQLGQETDAVAVTTLDIAEPTTYDLANWTDAFLLNGGYYYIPEPYNATTVIPNGNGTPQSNTVSPVLFAYIDGNRNGVYDALDKDLSRKALAYHFDFGGGSTLGSITLPASSFTRFAVLVNNASGPNTVLNLVKETYGYSVPILVKPNVNQQDPVTNQSTYSLPFLDRGRYVYQESPDYLFDPIIVALPPIVSPLVHTTAQTIQLSPP